jgi:hypothetical protein
LLLVLRVSLCLAPRPAFSNEGWSMDARGILFYPDDVDRCSATRRLRRDGDPTQPAIDSKLTDQGSDVVFEPLLRVPPSLTNSLGRPDLNVPTQGFVFTEHVEFNHGTLRLQATQALSSSTHVQTWFSYAPNPSLGDNEERKSGQGQLTAEKWTSYLWSTRLIHEVTPDVSVRLLGRYGLRRYNDAFSERNTDFWTIDPHVDWRVAPKIKLGLSYHDERGLAEGRHQPQFEDDTSDNLRLLRFARLHVATRDQSINSRGPGFSALRLALP